jgi:hypothetical protein
VYQASQDCSQKYSTIGRRGEVRVLPSHMQAFSTYHLLVGQEVLVWCDGLHYALSGWVGSGTGSPSVSQAAILTLSLSGTLILYNTPPTQGIALSKTAGTVLIRGTLFNRDPQNLQRQTMTLCSGMKLKLIYLSVCCCQDIV